MIYYAHKASDGKMQTLKQHLINVASMSESFAIPLLKPFAKAIGYTHDIGKYSEAFQERLNGKEIKFEHSSCGAIEYFNSAHEKNKLLAPMLEYCIAGHHTGLPDGGNKGDSPNDDVTLYSRLARETQYIGKNDYSAYKTEINLEFPQGDALIENFMKCNDKKEIIERYAFFTRYLFSCLTDADFIDTENFCCGNTDRTLKTDFSSAYNCLEKELNSFKNETKLQKARAILQSQAYNNLEKSNGISILTMPTGSGKTLCSLKIALKKILSSDNSKKRIIYVIPYTSIIEQTADEFNRIIGKCNDILQHHSNYTYESIEMHNRNNLSQDAESETTTSQKLKKATENWDAPVIITTAVQFFESLYDYRSSRLRKLHNMSNSIIIFDEIHLLPINVLQPCFRAIGYIKEFLNSEAILLSATMPDYTELFKRYLPEAEIHELITDKTDFKYFQKCRYIFMGKTDFENVISKTQNYNSSLVIVNSRKSAKEVYKLVNGEKYHLSTYMTPNDRSLTIEKIKQDLTNNERITVVSTSLVEAGVDFDFKAVFRELAGLDSILQSGGRCNREGKYDTGDVFIFETDAKTKDDLKIRAHISKKIIEEYNDISSCECIKEYYNRLFDYNDDVIIRNTITIDAKGVDNIPFRKYAQNFSLIKEDTVGIIINNCYETKELIERLKNKDYSAKRQLQRYTVGLKPFEFDTLLKQGVIDDFGTGVYILTNNNYYNKETGLDINYSNDIIDL